MNKVNCQDFHSVLNLLSDENQLLLYFKGNAHTYTGVKTVETNIPHWPLRNPAQVERSPNIEKKEVTYIKYLHNSLNKSHNIEENLPAAW
jgi:hypothetical protein